MILKIIIKLKHIKARLAYIADLTFITMGKYTTIGIAVRSCPTGRRIIIELSVVIVSVPFMKNIVGFTSLSRT